MRAARRCRWELGGPLGGRRDWGINQRMLLCVYVYTGIPEVLRGGNGMFGVLSEWLARN